MTHKFYGIAEIAEEIGARPGTVAQWYRRGKLPEPYEVLKMGPVWSAEQIKKWKSDYAAKEAIKGLNDQWLEEAGEPTTFAWAEGEGYADHAKRLRAALRRRGIEPRY